MPPATSYRGIQGAPDLVGRTHEDYDEELQEWLKKVLEKTNGIPAGFNELTPNPVTVGGTGSPGIEEAGWMAADAQLVVAAAAPGTPVLLGVTTSEGVATTAVRSDFRQDTIGLLAEVRSHVMDHC